MSRSSENPTPCSWKTLSSAKGRIHHHIRATMFLATLFLFAAEIPLLAQAITRIPSINTLAGDGTAGYSGDSAAATGAELNSPSGIAIDSVGNLYIADTANNRIRRVALGTGVISTFAGTGIAGYTGDGGTAATAQLQAPAGIAIDAAGNLYIADQGNNVIRKVNSAGVISTVAGNNEEGFSGDNGPATSATLYAPACVSVDSTGDLFIADAGNNRIREVNVTGMITTIAGTGTAGYSGDNGPATGAALNQPAAVISGSGGILYVADTGNNAIRLIAANGNITTFAGTGTAGYSGDSGPATSATLNMPYGLTTNSAGALYIADTKNNVLRMVAPNGNISKVAGTGVAGFSGDGGVVTTAILNNPRAVGFDQQGNLYLADQANNRVREINLPTGSVLFPTTAVGATSAPITIPLSVNDSGVTITSVTAPASLGGAQEYTVTISGCALNTALNAGTLCDVVVTFAPGYPGSRPVPLQVLSSSGTFSFGMSGVGTAPQAALSPGIITTAAYTSGVVALYGEEANVNGAPIVDSAGDVYVGVVVPEGHILAEAVAEFAAGTGTATSILQPEQDSGAFGLALDGAGDLYAAGPADNCVYEVAAGATAFSVVAGTCGGYGGGTGGFSGDLGLATAAKLNGPAGVAVDNAGNLFIADSGNNRIRKVSAVSGIITTIAGTGAAGSSGDSGLALNAQLNDPMAVALDNAGNLYIADYNNHRVREISAATGIITTLAGNGILGYSGDNGQATSAELNAPVSLAIDAAGNIYVADSGSDIVRRVNTAGIITTVAGTGAEGYSGDGGPATSAALEVEGVALDAAGNLYISDNGIRTVNVSASALTFPTAQIGLTTTQTVAVTNTGNASLLFTVPATGQNPVISAGFSLDSSTTCPQLNAGSQPGTLAPGNSCALAVDFVPTTAAAITGTAQIADNSLGTNSAQTVQLSGGAGDTVATTTTVNVTTPVFGQTAISATIAATAGSLSPVGSVVYTVDGAVQPAIPVNASGVATLPTAVSNALAVGSHTITANYTSSSLGFGNSLATRIFSVTPIPPSLTLAGSATSLSVAPGSSVTDTLTLTSVGGYAGTLQFACSNLPANAACSFQPATVVLSSTSGPQTEVVTIQTAGSAVAVRPPSSFMPGQYSTLPAAAIWAPGLLAMLLAGRKRRLSSRVSRCIISVVLFAGMLAMHGCGGGSITKGPTTPPVPVTPAGTSTVKITASASGSAVQSFSVTLVVQ